MAMAFAVMARGWITSKLLLSLVIATLFPKAAKALIDVSHENNKNNSNSVCDLYLFVPFTTFGYDNTFADQNWGYSVLSAALLAIDHFNERNPVLVPELGTEPTLQDCPIHLDIQAVLNADTNLATARQGFAERTLQRRGALPCAMVGPFHDGPALELSTLASSFDVPLVVPKANNYQVADPLKNPLTTQVFPGPLETGLKVLELLRQKGRTDFIGMVYALTDAMTQRREILAYWLDVWHMTWTAHAYLPFHDIVDSTRNVYSALSNLKRKGYRTIIVLMQVPWGEMMALADAAEALQMNQGDYLWVWDGEFDPSLIWYDQANVTKLLQGSLWTLPLSRVETEPDTDRFVQILRQQNASFVRRLNTLNPMAPEEAGYFFGTLGWVQEQTPVWTSSYMYDAVLSVGLGACRAYAAAAPPPSSVANNWTTTISSTEHVRGIRSVQFNGTSEQVLFGPHPGYAYEDDAEVSVRTPGTSIIGALNLLPPLPDHHALLQEGADFVQWIPTDLTGYYDSNNDEDKADDEWVSIHPIYYRDGRTVPPDLLRDEPNQNNLSPGLRIVGLTLMAIVLSLSLATLLWVFRYHNHRVLRAAQPHFLYLLAVGTAVQGSTILSFSFDESYGWSADQLGALCTSTIWLLTLGHIIVYGALFTKLWRVNRVLQFARRKIEIRHVAWPMALLFGSALLTLTIWTVVDPIQWIRLEIDADSGASIGRCECDHAAAFSTILIILMVIPTLLTEVMAWKTRDIDGAYAEGWYIFVLTLVQLEVLIVAVPVVVILSDFSTEGRYFGMTLLVWLLPLSTLLLIMGPKVHAVHFRKENDRSSIKRGQRTGVRVSGYVSSSNNTGAGGVAGIAGMDFSSSHSVGPPVVKQVDPIQQKVTDVDSSSLFDVPSHHFSVATTSGSSPSDNIMASIAEKDESDEDVLAARTSTRQGTAIVTAQADASRQHEQNDDSTNERDVVADEKAEPSESEEPLDERIAQQFQ